MVTPASQENSKGAALSGLLGSLSYPSSSQLVSRIMTRTTIRQPYADLFHYQRKEQDPKYLGLIQTLTLFCSIWFELFEQHYTVNIISLGPERRRKDWQEIYVQL